MFSPRSPRFDPERRRRVVGAILYIVFMLGGASALGFFFLVLPLGSSDALDEYRSMAVGALCALPALVIYLWIPRLIDRYDPEPWWALALVLGWGAVAASGVAATVNTVAEALAGAAVGPSFGHFVGACVSAPLVEEGMKGVAVFGVFYFLRREFDGVVDGVIYATFAALGFAAVENIIYYGAAARAGSAAGTLAATFAMRGILAPWGHPLYTSMTGIGFGVARETHKPWLKWVAPLVGYFCAVTLHFIWNAAAAVSGFLTILMLPLWGMFVIAFLAIVIWLVVRKGRIIRHHLEDEVLLGYLTRQELDLVCSPFAAISASVAWGGRSGRRFVRAASRLGLSKWHTGRALRGRTRTISADWIGPLRRQLFDLRAEMARACGRPLPQPVPWSASARRGAVDGRPPA